MRIKLVLVTALGFGAIAIFWAVPLGAQQQDDTATKTEVVEVPAEDQTAENFWMEQKLRLSKDMLAGLASADFDKIGRSAEVLKSLNRVEGFVRRGPEGYRDQLRQFNFANKALLVACEDENLEAATLAFNQLTISCVSCHQQLRKTSE